MTLNLLRSNLRFISSHPPDTTLITSDGDHIPTQQHLLSAASPYLASLLVQVGQGGLFAISVPFRNYVVRLVLKSLVSEEESGDEVESEGFAAAREMGIMFLKLKVAGNEDNFKKEDDHAEICRLEESTEAQENDDKEKISLMYLVVKAKKVKRKNR